MGLYHGLQVVLAVALFATVLRRLQILCFRSAADTTPLLRALRVDLEDGDFEAAVSLARRAGGSWVGSTALVLLTDPEELDEHLSDLRFHAFGGLDAVKVLARVGTASGLLGMVGYVLWMLNGDHGLLSLQAGLVESVAFQAAMVSAGIGVATAIFGFSSLGALTKIARRRIEEVDRVVRLVERRVGEDLAEADEKALAAT